MEMQELTQLLNRHGSEMTVEHQKMLEMVYQQLKKIAKSQKFKVSQQELNTTALVNEAWIKLNKNDKIFSNRNHFFATSAIAMRHILLNQAKKQTSRGISQPLEEDSLVDNASEALWFLDLEKHLQQLGEYSKRLEEVFVYRYFGGMKLEEIAELMSLSKRTVNRDWKKAKLMLSVALG
ncbi:ECF-type sigma factor [Marinicella sp. W31]|uniref:ECF-type sigma factor n=1 Tax=Marinicella sp. W31 TaxID=3023713 RepID=UPI0037583E44